MHRFVVLVLLVRLGAVMLSGRAAAQDVPPPPAGADVEIVVSAVGPGNRAREGSWTGLRVEYRDLVSDSRDIVLRVAGFDPDGDIPWYERAVVAEARLRSAWLFAPVPSLGTGRSLIVTAHEAEEGVGPDGEPVLRAGRLLGRAAVPPRGIVSASRPMLGIFGRREMGLGQYSTGFGSESYPTLAHELYEVVTNLGVADVPDRWQGLAAFETLVWGSISSDSDPARLTPDRARAIEAWVRRGGHLVVVLPAAGQTWTAASANPLVDLLPDADVTRREGVDLEPYRPMLTRDRDRALPSEETVHLLRRREGAGPREAMPILESRDGSAVVMRRVVGLGLVTLVGLDLASPALSAGVGTRLPEVESFWHRVLGRRGEYITSETLSSRDERTFLNAQQRQRVYFDAGIDEQIDRRGDAAAGVLLGFVVFAAYWLIAAPAGYYALGRFNARKHAWVAFLATTGVFTAAAWTGAEILRPRDVAGRHVAVVTEVHGTGVQGCRMWASVLVPEYGEATLDLGEPDAEPLGNNLLTPWRPVRFSAGESVGGFPDNRGYRVDARDPSEMRVPARSTTKPLRVDWAGNPRLGMPRVVGGGDLDRPYLRLLDDVRVEGVLRHDLPGTLRDVLVVVVSRPATLRPGLPRWNLWMPASARVHSAADWAPGDDLDLNADVTSLPDADKAITSAQTHFRRLVEGSRSAIGVGAARPRGDVADQLAAVSLFEMLGPPAFNRPGNEEPVATRTETHGLGLGEWFAQPCVIIIGRLDDEGVAPPAPLTVNGEAFESSGLTLVRWVYPLAADPPGYDDGAGEAEVPADGAG